MSSSNRKSEGHSDGEQGRPPWQDRRAAAVKRWRTALFTLLASLAVLSPGAAVARPGAGDAALAPLLQQKLKDSISAVERSVDGVFGVVVVDLQTGQRAVWNPDAVFPVASAIKLPILIELFRQSQQAEQGTAGLSRLGDSYTPRAEDIIADSNILAGLSVGTSRLTNRDLATFMVVVSDNGATNVLIDRLGMQPINSLLTRLGLGHTRLRRKMLDAEAVRRGQENTSTPAELAELWERLYRGQLLSPTYTADVLRLLSLHKEGYLSAELPEGVRLASKPGSLDGARTDAGVIWAGRKQERPFIVTAMVAYARDGRAAEAAIAHVAAAAYGYFTRLADSTSYGRGIPD